MANDTGIGGAEVGRRRKKRNGRRRKKSTNRWRRERRRGRVCIGGLGGAGE